MNKTGTTHSEDVNLSLSLTIDIHRRYRSLASPAANMTRLRAIGGESPDFWTMSSCFVVSVHEELQLMRRKCIR